MVNYSKGLVYKLCCNDTNITDIYVGSTTNFIRRKCGHKSDCCNETSKEHNRYVYRFIRQHGGWSNWSMVLIREYPDITNKKQLVKKERKYIDRLNATLNKVIPGRTDKEYYNDNHEDILEYHKNYYIKHADRIKKYQKDYNKQNFEYVKGRRKEYHKLYREANRQRICEKIECDCGCFISRANLAIHKKSNKHKDLMNDQ